MTDTRDLLEDDVAPHLVMIGLAVEQLQKPVGVVSCGWACNSFVDKVKEGQADVLVRVHR